MPERDGPFFGDGLEHLEGFLGDRDFTGDRERLLEQLKRSQLGDTSGPLNGPSTRTLVLLKVPLEFARPWVVTASALNTVAIPNPISGLNENVMAENDGAFARLRWGNGGVQSQADIDWRGGFRATVFGSFVELSVVMPVALDPVAAARGLPVFNAHVSPATGLTPQGNLTRTVPYGDLAAVTTVIRPVPPWARFVTYCFRGAAAAITPMRFTWRNGLGITDFCGFEISSTTLNHIYVNRDFRMPVPENARWFGIQNVSASLMENVAAEYELALE